MENKKCDNILLEKVEVRSTVYWWARRMENRLRLKDKSHKLGWLDGDLQHYVVQTMECWRKTVQAISYVPSKLLTHQQPKGIKHYSEITDKEVNQAIKKLVDLSNFAMMLADNLRNILLERGIKIGNTDSR